MNYAASRIHRQLLVAALVCFGAACNSAVPPTEAATSPSKAAPENHADGVRDSDVVAAQRVLLGRERTRSVIAACDPTYRAAGVDARYIALFWETGRFEILEGARIATQSASPTSSSRGPTSQPQSATPEQCRSLFEDNAPRDQRGIHGVAQEDVLRMHEIYAASGPDPNQSRDRSLYNDCMKSSYNSRQWPFEAAIKRCDCTIEAMRTVPASELNAWLSKAQRGENVPMTAQPWFGELFPKLQACAEVE
jgi:hypothetical protein